MTARPGQLRSRLTLEAPRETSDGAGGVVRTYEVVATMYGRIEPRRRRELVDDGRVVGLVMHRITVRHRGDVSGGMRFAAYGTHYRILSVEVADEQRRFLTCWCEEEQA